MFLVVVGAHSKWTEVMALRTATALAIVQCLRTLFARFGVPESIVTENGPQFSAQEVSKCNGIRHILIVPYHPAANSLAEHSREG